MFHIDNLIKFWPGRGRSSPAHAAPAIPKGCLHGAVAHGLKLDLFPAVDVALDEDLRDRGRIEAGLRSDGELISFLAEMGRIQADYQHIRGALEDVRSKGYGVVMPSATDLQLAEPEIVRKGGRYGVRLKASAKAIHMFQTTIETEVSPEIGGENASSEILGFLLQGFDGDVEQLWQSNIFGKPIYTIAREGVEEKLSCLPTKAVSKLQETLQRVVNEGSGTLICIIL